MIQVITDDPPSQSSGPVYPDGPYPYGDAGYVKPEYDLFTTIYDATPDLMGGDDLHQLTWNEQQVIKNKALWEETEGSEFWRNQAKRAVSESFEIFATESNLVDGWVQTVLGIVENILGASGQAHGAVETSIRQILQAETAPTYEKLEGIKNYSSIWSDFMLQSASDITRFRGLVSGKFSILRRLTTSIEKIGLLLNTSYEEEIADLKATIARLEKMLGKLLKENKILREEITRLKKELDDAGILGYFRQAGDPLSSFGGGDIQQYLKYGLYALGAVAAIKIIGLLK